jgi:hypothetical protein
VPEGGREWSSDEIHPTPAMTPTNYPEHDRIFHRRCLDQCHFQHNQNLPFHAKRTVFCQVLQSCISSNPHNPRTRAHWHNPPMCLKDRRQGQLDNFQVISACSACITSASRYVFGSCSTQSDRLAKRTGVIPPLTSHPHSGALPAHQEPIDAPSRARSLAICLVFPQ